uniref:HAT C-terminal dimerisation domain-containing protein n=1 Tax=Sinocyclocheilus grahami TaxID=75366 RepID=A0A672SP70_SINGR
MAGMEKVPCVPQRLEREKEVHHLLLKKINTNLADLLGKRKAQSSNSVPKRIRTDTEVARYLQEEALDLHSDLLAWWRDNQARFPLLSKVARKCMTICTTSAPSERVFSAAGNISVFLLILLP